MALLIAGAFIFIPLLILAGIGYGIYKYSTRPEPTSKIIEATQGVVARADFPSPDEFLNAFHDRYIKDCEAAKIPASGYHARTSALSAAYQIYEVEDLHAQPSPLTSVIDGTIEAARYRDFVLAKARLAANPARTMTVLADALSRSLVAYTKALPRIASDEGDNDPDNEAQITVPLIDLMPNVAETISDIVFPFFQPDAIDLGLFKVLRAQLDQNFNLASEGYKKLLEPKDFKGTPREMIKTYLQGTPLEGLFLADVPFSFGTAIFEHQWCVAPQGAGKTQYIQYQISQRLEEVAAGKASVLVMDSQSDLIKLISGLKIFAEGQPLHDKICLIEPSPDFPLALNPFDMGKARLQGYNERTRETVTATLSTFSSTSSTRSSRAT